VAYRELILADRHVACLWVRDAEPETRQHRIVPDACVDVVWTGARLVVAGPATGPALTEVPAARVHGLPPAALLASGARPAGERPAAPAQLAE